MKTLISILIVLGSFSVLEAQYLHKQNSIFKGQQIVNTETGERFYPTAKNLATYYQHSPEAQRWLKKRKTSIVIGISGGVMMGAGITMAAISAAELGAALSFKEARTDCDACVAGGPIALAGLLAFGYGKIASTIFLNRSLKAYNQGQEGSSSNYKLMGSPKVKWASSSDSRQQSIGIFFSLN